MKNDKIFEEFKIFHSIAIVVLSILAIGMFAILGARYMGWSTCNNVGGDWQQVDGVYRCLDESGRRIKLN